MFKRFGDTALQRRVADLETDLAVKDRIIAVQKVELENLAAVVARDRERIRAESAGFAASRAASEGVKNG